MEVVELAAELTDPLAQADQVHHALIPPARQFLGGPLQFLETLHQGGEFPVGVAQ
jgi:hypothetical protein